MLNAAIRENSEMKDQRESTSYHGYEMCQQGSLTSNAKNGGKPKSAATSTINW